MTPSHEDQGTGYDPDARGYELQGRRAAPDPEPAPDSELPATDARDDFATDPADQNAPPAASAPQADVSAAKDGPKDPEPAALTPEAPTASEPPPVAYPELHEEHPARLPPAARPIRQG